MSPEMMAGAGIASGVFAGILLLAFAALWSWCYSARRRPAFDAAARMPLEDDVYRSAARSCCVEAPVTALETCGGDLRGEAP